MAFCVEHSVLRSVSAPGCVTPVSFRRQWIGRERLRQNEERGDARRKEAGREGESVSRWQAFVCQLVEVRDTWDS